MRIGDLAKRVNTSVETIRYYEKAGLLTPAKRDALNNYRHYDQSHLEQLVFIRRCRTLAMAHSEIQQLLRARIQPDESCATINSVIAEHLQHVQSRIVELQQLEQQLSDLNNHCQAALATRDCGILKELVHPLEDGFSPLSSDNHIDASHCHNERHK